MIKNTIEMRVKLKYKKNVVRILFCMAVFLLTGCSTGEKGTVSGTNYYYPRPETETKEASTEETVKAQFDAEHYMIITNNMTKEYMVVKQLMSGKQSVLTYSLTTNFLDKYGNNTSVSAFECGQIITLGEKDFNGKLKSVQLSENIWEYEDVIRYKIDEERNIFQIADTKYYFEEGLNVFSEGKPITISDIKVNDEIKVVGMNKQILSVSVTTGQGAIALKNTELFEDSFIQIGSRIFAEITGEMELEVPEGNYIVSVANKGYGGSKEYDVKRGEITVIDLNELKGEGPKMGAITFEISTVDENTEADIVFRIDGEEVDYEEPIELAYGIHSIRAESYGYETYAKKLFVNSEDAVIAIHLDTELLVSDEETDEDENEQREEVNTNLAGTLAGNTANTDEENDSDTTDTDALIEALTNALSEDSSTDYLSTLSGLLGNVLN